MRWYFRRKMNRVIDEVNARFNIEIPAFKLTRRQVLIDRLFHDEKVQVAVGINYNRVLKDRTLLRKLETTLPKCGFFGAVATILSFFARNAWLMVSGRWYRYGYACVNFGSPLSIRDHVARAGVDFRALDDDARHRAVERVGLTLILRRDPDVASIAGGYGVCPDTGAGQIVCVNLFKNKSL